MRWSLALFLLIPNFVYSQPKGALVSGKVVDENDSPLAGVSVIILGRQKGVTTDDQGVFSIVLPAQRATALVFSHTGYADQQRNLYLSEGENENVVIRLKRAGKELETVTVSEERDRKEAGLISLNAAEASLVPGAVSGIEGMIKTIVGSNNELTSQYNVRGGNFDENLVYINDFEIFRPYLVSSGQQEGLSFINPELSRGVQFYSGAFPAKYGDKMSSVLDISYKKPKHFGGSAYAGLLEQGVHIEASSSKNNLSFLAGIRNKSNGNLLSNQPTVGAYLPAASDFQGLLSWQVSEKIQVELLGIYSVSRFRFSPETVKKTTSVFSPFFTANLGLDIYFEGQERDSYKTGLIGATISHRPTAKLKLRWMASRFTDNEKENFDIAAAYLFGDRDFDNSSSTFGQIINPLGAGYYQDYGRNSLKIEVLNLMHKGSFSQGKHFVQWGAGAERNKISDKLHQWQYRDSAGYSLPANTPGLNLSYAVNSTTDLNVMKYHAFVQDNIRFSKPDYDLTLSGGIRIQYNDLNKEILLSPRFQAALKPAWKKDLVFKIAGGLYHQPPFYREFRDYSGNINTQQKAQKSFQAVTGFDYSFYGPGQRPMRLSAEAYYKKMWDVAPYDIDNVKIRYLGGNDAKAYATGLEVRLFGELLKDAESWVSLGIMRTRENLKNDSYYKYYNAAGELITSSSVDKIIADSAQQNVGYLRRPSDRLITLGLYLQDYLTTNKNFKVHLNMIYGSNMPFNIPNSVRYRNALVIEPYIRADLGFSVLLLKEKSLRRFHDPFRAIQSAWLSVEVFNLINRENTISYQLISDFSNTTYAIPNRLTPRLFNIKILGRF